MFEKKVTRQELDHYVKKKDVVSILRQLGLIREISFYEYSSPTIHKPFELTSVPKLIEKSTVEKKLDSLAEILGYEWVEGGRYEKLKPVRKKKVTKRKTK